MRTVQPHPEESSTAAPEVPETVADEPAVDETVAPAEQDDSQVEPPEVEPAVEKSPRRKFLRRRKNRPIAEIDSDATNSAAEAIETADVEATEVAEGDDAETAKGDDAETAEGDDSEVTESDAAAETVLVPHRPAGKRLKIAAAAAAVLFVAGGAFVGATAQPVIANRALVETKLEIARTAANAITTLWSYTPDNMDSLAQRSARYLTGDFAFQYRKFIDSIVATNKQAQVTNTTSVLGTAVESLSQTEASAIVYTNSVATSPVSKNIPSLRYLSYRLEMKRDRSDWRITRMTTITTLDLTPQL